MSLKSRILADNTRVFMNQSQFASEHTWNGTPFTCVCDEEGANIKKNGNVIDESWDNNTREVIVYVTMEEFPGKPIVNESGYLDNVPVRLLQVNEDEGMLTLLFVSYEPKAVHL